MRLHHRLSALALGAIAWLGATLPSCAQTEWHDPAGDNLRRQFWDAFLSGHWGWPFTLLLIVITLLSVAATLLLLFILASAAVTLAVALGWLPPRRKPHEHGPKRSRWIETLDNPELFAAFLFDLATGSGSSSGDRSSGSRGGGSYRGGGGSSGGGGASGNW
jgi:uncharacterized membrane protein YgcG